MDKKNRSVLDQPADPPCLPAQS